MTRSAPACCARARTPRRCARWRGRGRAGEQGGGRGRRREDPLPGGAQRQPQSQDLRKRIRRGCPRRSSWSTAPSPRTRPARAPTRCSASRSPRSTTSARRTSSSPGRGLPREPPRQPGLRARLREPPRPERGRAQPPLRGRAAHDHHRRHGGPPPAGEESPRSSPWPPPCCERGRPRGGLASAAGKFPAASGPTRSGWPPWPPTSRPPAASAWWCPASASPPRCTPWRTPSTRRWATWARRSRFVPASSDQTSGVAGLRALADELKSGAVDTLVITAWNPVYPRRWTWACWRCSTRRRTRTAASSASSTPRCTRTRPARYADWFVPAAHELEAWSDGRSIDGTVIHRPAAHPAALQRRAPPSELLALFLASHTQGALPELRDCWREYWRTQAGAGDFETAWETWVGEGVVPRSAPAAAQRHPEPGRPPRAALNAYRSRPPASSRSTSSPTTRSTTAASPTCPGCRSSPDPISKMTWDNAALPQPGHREAAAARGRRDVADARPTAAARWTSRCGSSPARGRRRDAARWATAARPARDGGQGAWASTPTWCGA